MEEPSLSDWNLGFSIDPAEVQLSHLIGKGSSGEVYYATWNGFPVVAKKILHNLLVGKKREAFLREARLLTRLR